MNVLDLAQQYGQYLKAATGSRRGPEYHGPCPGCGGNDRFHIWPDQNNGEGSYWCRQCEKSGDIIQFLIDFNGRTYHEACEILDKKPGEYVPPSKPVTPALPTKKQEKPRKWDPETVAAPADQWRAAAKKFIDYCHEALLENDEQMAYLASRGLDPETVISARLGWNSENRYRPRSSWGLEEIEENGKKKKLWLPRGLVIPCFDMADPDNIIRVKIRRTDADRKDFLPDLKYYAVQGSSKAPMVLGREKDAFCVIESELDSLLVFQDAGDLVGVVGLSSKSVRPDAGTAAVLSQALVILDCLDYDGTAVKDTAAWKENFPQTKRWPVPQGKDPGDAVASGVDIRAWILAGLPPRYHVGQSRLKRACAEGKGVEKQVQPETSGFVASNDVEKEEKNPLKRLAAEMKHTPLVIANHPDRLSLMSKNKSWKDRNWSMFGRVSDLLFLDPKVREAVGDLEFGDYGFSELEKVSVNTGVN